MKINSKQASVLVIAVVLFSMSLLFPPWLYEDGYDSAKRSAGYHFYYSRAEVKSDAEMRKIFLITESDGPHSFSAQKDKLRLYSQILAILFSAIGLLLFFNNKRNSLKVAFGSIFTSL